MSDTPSLIERAYVWQPIESAPKDGSRMLLWAGGWGSPITDTDAHEFGKTAPMPVIFPAGKGTTIYQGCWWPGQGDGPGNGAGWYSHNKFRFLIEPTHWTPQPQPPLPIGEKT